MKTTKKNEPIFLGDKISQFTVNAPWFYIWFAFWIRVEFREADAKDRDDWYRSDRGPSVSVGLTKRMNLDTIVGLQEGMHVRLDIEVNLGSEHVRAQQIFVYKKDSLTSASYKATGTSLDAAVTYKELIGKK